MSRKKSNLPQHKAGATKGYFKENFSYYSAKTLEKMFADKMPNWKKNISETVGISQGTLNKMLNNKDNSHNFRLSTIKKLSQGINKELDVQKQIQFAKIAIHLKKYNGISEKKMNSIIGVSKRESKRYKGLKQKSREWVLFRIIYGSGKGK